MMKLKTFAQFTCLSLALGLSAPAMAASDPEPPPVAPGEATPDPDAAPPDDAVPAPVDTAPAPTPDDATPVVTTSEVTLEAAEPIYVTGGLFGTGITVAAKLGGSFSQVFNALGAAFTPELEVGVTLPFADRMLEVFCAGQWAAPQLDGTTEPDPRLPGDGTMSYHVTQQELALTLGLRLRIPIDSELFRPHVALGGRAYFLKTEVSGDGGGEPFGANAETTTRFGFFGALGGELFVGPGAILLEVQVGYATLDRFVMRNTNVGALNVLVGYRLFL